MAGLVLQLVEDEAARPDVLAGVVEAARHREEHRLEAHDHRLEDAVAPARLEQLSAAADPLADRCRTQPERIAERSDHHPAGGQVAGGVCVRECAFE
jgi:hypothetical protein